MSYWVETLYLDCYDCRGTGMGSNEFTVCYSCKGSGLAGTQSVKHCNVCELLFDYDAEQCPRCYPEYD